MIQPEVAQYLRKCAAAVATNGGMSDAEATAASLGAGSAGILGGALGAEYLIGRSSDKRLARLSRLNKKIMAHEEAWKNGSGTGDAAEEALRARRIRAQKMRLEAANTGRLMTLKSPLGRALVIGGSVLGGLGAGLGTFAGLAD